MDLERQRRAAQIFQSLLDLPAPERAAALAEACDGDASLQAEVRALIDLDEGEASGLFQLSDVQLSAPAAPTGAQAALLQTGQVIDRYIVQKRLGVGGMAEVWAARHQTLGTWHAIKVLLWASPALQERLLQEGRAQARLAHRNILPVRDILDLSGTPALLMPLIEGPSLDRILKHHRLTADEALALFGGILDGVEHAHRAGTVHRDIKPGNVLIDLRHGQLVPVVADFGLVKELGGVAMTVAGAVMGTPAYAAPEQLADASAADHRADIFSLGVLLAELLTGTLPFPGRSLAQIRRAHSRPPKLGGAPEALRTLLAAMLQRDPADRPPSCAAVRAALPEPGEDTGGLHEAVRTLTTPAPPGPPTSSVQAPHNLPRLRDRFIGRTDELEALAGRLAGGERLVTIVGPGGTGKTRLSLQLARKILPDWSGGVWMVDLSECHHLEEILVAISRALDVPLPAPSVEAVTRQLAARGRCLVILDNFEQIADLAPQTVGVWLDALPDAAFLVTSRRPLRLRGERVFPVSPLRTEAGIDLFIERARAVNPGFVLSEEGREDLSSLISLLDGLPLAIELAAARARTMSPARLLTRLSRRFDLLTSRSADLPARQRTLRATVAWSWELLSPPERAVLAQCSVFEGGFTVEAAEEILDLSRFEDAPWVEDVLAELVDRSLLVSTTHRAARQTRLSMLVSIQAFAREKLPADSTAPRRHSRWFAQAGTRASQDALTASRGTPRYRSWVLEIDNIHAAARSAISAGDLHTASLATFALMELTFQRGPLSIPLTLCAEILDRWSGPPDQNKAQILWGQGVLLSINGSETGALDLYTEALKMCSQIEGDIRALESRIRHSAGYLLARMRRFEESETHFTRGVALVADLPPRDAFLQAQMYGGLANLYRRSGRLEASIPFYQRSVHIRRSRPGNIGLDAALNNMALAYLGLGQHDTARMYFKEGLELARRNRALRTEGTILGNLASCEPDAEKRMVWHTQTLELAQRAGSTRDTLHAHRDIGLAHILLGDLTAAAQHLNEAARLAVQIGQDSALIELEIGFAELCCLTEAPAAAQAAVTVRLGRIQGGSNPFEEGFLLTMLGIIALDLGEPEVAAGRLRRALASLNPKVGEARRARIRLWEALTLLDNPTADELIPLIEADIKGGRDAPNPRLWWCCAQGRVAKQRGDESALEAAMARIAAVLEAAEATPWFSIQEEIRKLQE